MDQRRASIGTGLLLLALTLAWWALRPVVPPLAAVVAPSSSAAPAPSHFGLPVPATTPIAADEEELPPMDPPPEVRRRQRAALDLIADASGLYVVDCPEPELPDGGGYTYPGWWVVGSPTGRGSAFTTDQPEGVIALLSEPTKPTGAGGVLGVLHWSQGSDGKMRCVEEPVEEHHVPVRVVDRAGRPAPGATVQVENGGFQGLAGPDGVVDLVLQADAPASVQAFAETGISDLEWIGPDDHPTLRLTLGGDTEEEVLAAVQAMVAERYAAKRRAIAATLAGGAVPSDLAQVLTAWDEQIERDEPHHDGP